IFGNECGLVELGLSLPITLTSWHVLVATVATRAMSYCTSGLADVGEADEVLNWRQWLTAFFPIGFLFSVGLGLSYLYLSVSSIQMVKPGIPIGILLADWIFRASRPNDVFLNILVTFGIAIAPYTSTVAPGISGLVKDLSIVAGSAHVFQIPLTTLQWLGCGISLVGIARCKLELSQSWNVSWPNFLRPKRRLSAVVSGILLLGAVASATLYFIGDPNHAEAVLSSQKTPARRPRLSRKDTPGRESSSKRQAIIDNFYRMGEISWPNYFDELDSAALAPLTRELADALEIDRIFMLSPTGCGVGQSYVEEGCGRGETYSNLECLVQPLSSCSIADATAPGVDVIDAPTNPAMVSAFREAPTVWRERLAELHPEANLTEGFFRYWWRAQSAAYITRLNRHTSQAVRTMRHNSSLHAAWSAGSKEGNPAPYPLHTGTINLH
ncbi:MAG: hypothetical protein BJ554DRAFT_712, partial [Olpidium bornovanus]